MSPWHKIPGMRPRREGGFTLVEILIASAVLALGMVGVLMMFVVATETHRRAVHASQTAQMAEVLLAELTGAMCLEEDGHTLRVPVAVPDKTPSEETAVIDLDDTASDYVTDAGHADFTGYRYDVFFNVAPEYADDTLLLPVVPIACDGEVVKVTIVIKYASGNTPVRRTYETVIPIRPFSSKETE